MTSLLYDQPGFYLARVLSAFGIYGHDVLLGLVLGTPWLIVASESLWITRRDEHYKALAFSWTKALVILLLKAEFSAGGKSLRPLQDGVDVRLPNT